MNVLILGGTQFVGRHIAEAMVLAGHQVTVFNRGKTPDMLSASVERLRGDRDLDGDGLAVLAGRKWDACIDVSGYTSRQVRASAMLLAGQVRRYVFISAVSVYGDPHQPPVTEDFPRSAPASDAVTEIDSTTYGPLKVACENIIEQVYGRRCSILRPQIVAGPYDPLDRFSYWVRRAGQSGTMLAPGDGSDHLQFIDARDVARFTVGVIERNIAGSFNLAGPRLTWAEFI
jgi:2'-hydroxyisoflavone reductase